MFGSLDIFWTNEIQLMQHSESKEPRFQVKKLLVLTVVYSFGWQLSLIAGTSSVHLWDPFLSKDNTHNYFTSIFCASRRYSHATYLGLSRRLL